MGRKITFTKKVREFIIDKMSQGYDIAQICDKWPDKVPHRNSIYRKAATDSEFAQEIDQAYTVLLMHRMDELHKISSLTASEAYPHVEDWRQAEAALRRRIDEAKFILGKMAPILSKRFSTKQQIEVSGDGLSTGPQIVIQNYSTKDISEEVTIEGNTSDNTDLKLQIQKDNPDLSMENIEDIMKGMEQCKTDLKSLVPFDLGKDDEDE